MQLTDKPIVISLKYSLNPDDGNYYVNLSFDTGHTEVFPVDSSLVDQNKLTF